MTSFLCDYCLSALLCPFFFGSSFFPLFSSVSGTVGTENKDPNVYCLEAILSVLLTRFQQRERQSLSSIPLWNEKCSASLDSHTLT